MKAEALFLGTGASMGVPVIGCTCHVCQSESSFNNRMRPSLLLMIGKKRYLIDIGPDFRLQALRYQIDALDGVILTHSHYDHIGGLDELRIFYFREKKAMPCLVSRETFEELKVRYHYLLSSSDLDPASFMQLNFQILESDEGVVEFEGVKLAYFSYFQKGTKVIGVRFQDFAYVVDILDYPQTIFKCLKGVDKLVIDGMKWERTSAHLGILDVIEFAKKVGSKTTYLTHVAHETDHESTSAKLPDGMELAYDGLKLDL